MMLSVVLAGVAGMVGAGLLLLVQRGSHNKGAAYDCWLFFTTSLGCRGEAPVQLKKRPLFFYDATYTVEIESRRSAASREISFAASLVTSFSSSSRSTCSWFSLLDNLT